LFSAKPISAWSPGDTERALFQVSTTPVTSVTPKKNCGR
jgi:hypothetical protein